MFENYDRVRVISLIERTDRRKAIIAELARFGVRPEFFDAFRINGRGLFMNPGAHGGFLSHMAVLSEAAAKGESILVLEDDCTFAGPFQIPQCDIFWGGYEAVGGDLRNADLIGAHCIGYSAKAAKLASSYLRNLLDPAFPPDPKAAKDPNFNPDMRPPADGALAWFIRAHPELTVEFAQVAGQRASRSDITPAHFYDRIPLIRDLADWARRLRGSRARWARTG